MPGLSLGTPAVLGAGVTQTELAAHQHWLWGLDKDIL